MEKSLRAKISLKVPAHFFALGFGSGLASFMPGTFGTLAALPLVVLAWLLGPTSYLLITLLACLVGVWICDRTSKDMGVHDHSSIVWDEVAGMLITMLLVPMTWQTLLAGFALFRFFDIVKPWPIRYLDKHVHGGLGIMLDDIVAGVFSCLVLHASLYFLWLL